MSFVNPSLLWLCLLGLIPWIIYLLQILLGRPFTVPSLIYIQENQQKKIKKRYNLLIFFLQSLALTLLGFIFADPYLEAKNSSYLCIVDDSLHSQLSIDKMKSIRNQLYGSCQGQFLSGSSFSLNRFEVVDDNQLNRLRAISWQQTLKYLEQLEKEKKQVLLILPEQSYIKGMEKFSQIPLNYFLFPLLDKENIYFKHMKLELNPLDYRKRNLSIQLSEKSGAGQKVIIEKSDQKTVVQTGIDGSFQTELTVNFNTRFEVIKLTIQGDQYLADNYAYAIIHQQLPYGFQFGDGQLPQTVQSILQQNSKEFAFPWFDPKIKNRQIILKNLPVVSGFTPAADTLYFFNASGLPRYLDEEAQPFQAYFIQATTDVSRLNLANYQVLQKFRDGMASLIRFPQLRSGIFMYDPDSALDALKFSPAYPIMLMKSILALIQDNSHIFQSLNDEEEQLFRGNSPAPLQIGIRTNNQNLTAIGDIQKILQQLEPDSKLASSDIAIVNYRANSAMISGINFPQDRIFQQGETKPTTSNWQAVFILVFLLLLLGIFFLERPEKR